MVMDLASREYYFSFFSNWPKKFNALVDNVKDEDVRASTYFQQLAKDGSKIVKLTSAFPETNPFAEVLNEYSGPFPGQLTTVKGTEYEIELVD
jgi:hypothetical protein